MASAHEVNWSVVQRNAMLPVDQRGYKTRRAERAHLLRMRHLAHANGFPTPDAVLQLGRAGLLQVRGIGPALAVDFERVATQGTPMEREFVFCPPERFNMRRAWSGTFASSTSAAPYPTKPAPKLEVTPENERAIQAHRDLYPDSAPKPAVVEISDVPEQVKARIILNALDAVHAMYPGDWTKARTLLVTICQYAVGEINVFST